MEFVDHELKEENTEPLDEPELEDMLDIDGVTALDGSSRDGVGFTGDVGRAVSFVGDEGQVAGFFGEAGVGLRFSEEDPSSIR